MLGGYSSSQSTTSSSVRITMWHSRSPFYKHKNTASQCCPIQHQPHWFAKVADLTFCVIEGNIPCNLSCNFVGPLQHKLHGLFPGVTCPEMNMPYKVFVAVTVATSTSSNDCGNKKIQRHVHFRACYTRQ